MKALILIPILFLISCNNPATNKQPDVADTTTTKQTSIEKTQLYATTDSVIISSENFDTLVYSREDFNEIIDNFPALYETTPSNPDISYTKSGCSKDIIKHGENKKHITFGSEAGQDEYYMLYSYFLKKENGDSDLENRRKTLVSIYLDINEIFSLLNYGSTFFGHQVKRITGYAEFGVYQYKQYNDIFNKPYDIKEQKKLYLASLKENINQEISIDNEIPDKTSKSKREKELLEYVAHLDSLITDNFYLKKAQEFQYSTY